jgi:hypothetical protein
VTWCSAGFAAATRPNIQARLGTAPTGLPFSSSLPMRVFDRATGCCMENIHHWAVLVAAASSFVLGGPWYGPLFKMVWCREAGVDPDPAKVFDSAFLLQLLAAAMFPQWLGLRPDVADAVIKGAVTGAAFVAAGFGINCLFADQSRTPAHGRRLPHAAVHPPWRRIRPVALTRPGRKSDRLIALGRDHPFTAGA